MTAMGAHSGNEMPIENSAFGAHFAFGQSFRAWALLI
jgi:hypothetical protein